MITQNDIIIYVAAKKSSAPKLPLREALVTVALECVYEPNPTENKQVRNRRRVVIANFLKRPKHKRQVQACTLYSHEKNNGGEMSLSSYIEEWNRLENQRNDGVSTLGASTLSSKTSTKIDREVLATDILEIDSYKSLGIPSLAMSDDDGEEIEDMTMDTYALIGGITSKPIPGVVITKDDDNSDKWWYEEDNGSSPTFCDNSLDIKELPDSNYPESNESRSQSLSIESLHDTDEGLNSSITCGDEVSVILNSAFVAVCPNESLLLPAEIEFCK